MNEQDQPASKGFPPGPQGKPPPESVTGFSFQWTFTPLPWTLALIGIPWRGSIIQTPGPSKTPGIRPSVGRAQGLHCYGHPCLSPGAGNCRGCLGEFSDGVGEQRGQPCSPTGTGSLSQALGPGEGRTNPREEPSGMPPGSSSVSARP